MCRSIKTLRSADVPATDEDVRAAALQFVRKVSGYRVPSRANQAVFEAAVDEVAASTRRLLSELAGPGRRPIDGVLAGQKDGANRGEVRISAPISGAF